MRVNKFSLPILTLLALFGAVFTAKAAGIWTVSGKQSIDVQSLSSAEDIRGWMSFEELSTGYNIPLPRLYQLLNIPDDIPPETALKDMEGLLPDFEVTVVRDLVAEFLDDKSNHVPTGDGASPLEGTGRTPVPAGTQLAGSEIKGRHTLAEIASQCQVPLPALLQKLALPADTDPSLAAKDLVEQGALPEIQTLRDAVTGLQSP